MCPVLITCVAVGPQKVGVEDRTQLAHEMLVDLLRRGILLHAPPLAYIRRKAPARPESHLPLVLGHPLMYRLLVSWSGPSRSRSASGELFCSGSDRVKWTL